MTAAVPRPRTRARPVAALSCIGALGLLLSGCGQAEPEPEVPEMAEPPNRELEGPRLVAGAQMPVWGLSAACDEPRPQPDEDGLRVPAPAPDEEHIVFFVPPVEATLCAMPAVASASLAGSYTEDGGREGEADLGLVFAPGAAAEQMEAAWSTGAAEAQAQLDGTGIALADSTLLLDDGSLITGPTADPADPAAPAAPADPSTPGASIPQAISLLTQLRAASPIPEEEPGTEETAAGAEPTSSASGTPGAEPGEPAPEEQEPVPRWRIETGRGLEVTAVYTGDLSAEGALEEMAGVLKDTQDVRGEDAGAARTDAVSVIDGRLQLTVEAPRLELLSEDLAQDLDALGLVPDLEATARLGTGEDGRPVLSVRSHRLPEYSQPQYEQAAEELEVSAAEAGVVLDHRLDGEPLPLEEQ